MKSHLFATGLALALFLPGKLLASDRALNCSVDSTNVDKGGRIEVTVELDNSSTAFGGPFDSSNITVNYNYSAGFEFFAAGPPPGITVSDNIGSNSLTITYDAVAAGASKSVDFELRALTTVGSWPSNGNITGGAPGDPDSSNNTCELFVNIIDPIAPGSAGNLNNDGSVRDPISTFNGEFYNQFDADLDLGGPMGLSFSRYYGSMMSADGISNGVLGDNWRHNFEWSLNKSDTTATIISSNGARIEFAFSNGSWNQTSSASKKYQFVEDSGTGALALLDVQEQRFYVFNADGLLTSVLDGRGNQHGLSYNGSNQLTQVTDGVGRTLTFSYTDNKLSTVSDGTRTVSFSYTANNLTSSSSALGHTTTYAYAAGGLMTSSTRPAGNTIVSQVYDSSGKVTSQDDGESNTTTLSYGNGNVTTITDALGASTVHTHTGTGELSRVEDANGNTIDITSNNDGLRASITDRLGAVTNLTYHSPSNDLASIVDANGNTTSYTYSSRSISGLTLFDRTGINHADGSTESMTYDGLGNLTSRTDQLGNSFSYTYNSTGQQLSSTFPSGGTTTNSYNADGTLASVTGPMGNSTNFSYDALKRPNVTTFADGSTRKFNYDHANRVTSFTDENNNTTSFVYDNNDNLQSLSTPLGETFSYTYDGNDQPVSFTDPLGAVVNISYDALGRIATVSDAGGNVTTNGYDALGQLTSVTDPLGNIWSTSYNLEGEVASRTNPLGNRTTFQSDNLGRVTQVTSPLGNASKISYNPIGLITSTTDPLGNVTSYSRDAVGSVTGIALDDGAVATTYTRNALGQLLTARDPGGNNWNTAYDAGGRLTSQSDPLGNTSTLTYNNRNMISVVSYPGNLGTMTLGYDAANNMTSRSYTDGTSLSYTYDANNRMLTADGISTAYDANGRIINSNGILSAYDAQGRMVSMTLAAGKEVAYAYDANDRLVSVTDWAGGVTTFTYDAAGNLLTVKRPNSVNRSNSFDADSRLIAITEGADVSISLTRDANDQIVSADRTAPSLATAKSANDFTGSFDAASQVASYSYDALGRVTQAGSDSYTWNLASRLSSYTRNGVTTTATYDGLGNRLSRTVGNTTSNYVWNYALAIPSILIEKQGASDLRYFIRTPEGNLLYSIDASSNARLFYHFDEMGNTMFVSNDAGTTVKSYAYSPFGALSASSGELDNPFTWQGELGAMDEGDGFYYLRARYYDANSARFISRDTIQNPDPRTINPYQYALNNPLLYTDDTGRAPKKVKPVSQREVNDAGRDLVVAISGNTPLSAFSNGYTVGRGIAEGNTDDIVSGGAGLAVDAGTVYLTGAAATAEAGALTGASIAGPVVIVYAGAKLGIVYYEAVWDLRAARQRLEATIFAGELERKKAARIQAERQARILEERRLAHEKSEQREQKFRDENKAREEAEAREADTSETGKAAKFLFN